MCFNVHYPFDCPVVMSPSGGHDGVDCVGSPSSPGSALGESQEFNFVSFFDALTVAPGRGSVASFALVIFVGGTVVGFIVVRRTRRRGPLGPSPPLFPPLGSPFGSPCPTSPCPMLVSLLRPRVLEIGRRGCLMLLRCGSPFLLQNCLRIRCTQDGRRSSKRSS